MRSLSRFPFLTTAAMVLTGLLLVVLAPARDAQAGIAGTAHDLSAQGWGTTQICIFCHTPHNAQAVPGAPLWNHAVTVATFSAYTSATLNAVVGQPTGTSKLCLSCHDGTVALDSYGGNAGTHFMDPGGAKLGTDLTNDHPISFTYDAALATSDGGLKSPVSDKYVDAASILPLFGAQMQCATCHSVHDNSKGKFLRMLNNGSALCLACHLK